VTMVRIRVKERGGEYNVCATDRAILLNKGSPILTCNQERRDLVEDLLNAELLLRKNIFIHVALIRRLSRSLSFAFSIAVPHRTLSPPGLLAASHGEAEDQFVSLSAGP